MPCINTLASGVQCSNICLISLQDTRRGGDKVIKMYDGQCYYTKYIYLYIINLIKKGLKLGDSDFVLPTKKPIIQEDLDLLYLDPNDFDAMHEAWLESPAHAVEQAQIERESLAAYTAAAEADTVHVPVIQDGNGNHEIDTLLRWGVQLDRDVIVELPIEYINRVDRFLLPVGYDNNFDHNNDENIGSRRIRNIGINEINFIFTGQPIPPGTPLLIVFNHEFYNSLEELAVAMSKTVAEIRGNVTGGKRKTKRRRVKRAKSRRR
jgi:hypothetical protein